MHALRTQCKVLYGGNYLNPSFGSFSQVFHKLLFRNRFFCASCALKMWRNSDDGESPDVVYIHNATNRKVGCYTLLSRFQLSWPLPFYL